MKGSAAKFASPAVPTCRANMLPHSLGKPFSSSAEGNGGGSAGKLMKVWEIRVSSGEGRNRLALVSVSLLGLVTGVPDLICGRRESTNKRIMPFGAAGHRPLVARLGSSATFQASTRSGRQVR